jgi:hypothetical protein
VTETPSAQPHHGRSPAPDKHGSVRVIDDNEFQQQLFLLRRTRRFLIEEGVNPATVAPDAAGIPAGPAVGESPFSLGELNLIKDPPVPTLLFWKRTATSPPTLADWQLLEEKQNGLQRYFNVELQDRFRLQNTRQIITLMPFALLLIAFTALVFAVAIAVFPPEGFFVPAWRFVAFPVWTLSLGGLGAIGFLAVNSLAIQDDATFDISNAGLVGMRIVLGALFGCIVSLPFCFAYFRDFTDWVIKGGDIAGGRGVLLLVPFLLGFSTTLVMAVLNRMIAGIEAMFGIERSPQRTRDTAGGRAVPDTPSEKAPAPKSEETGDLKGRDHV